MKYQFPENVEIYRKSLDRMVADKQIESYEIIETEMGYEVKIKSIETIRHISLRTSVQEFFTL